ncbi:DoxX family protein [Candidatus Gracilibacteria bacterium]|nr:DoxX family protein [Candidatus Gracilibacteria bacterium]
MKNSLFFARLLVVVLFYFSLYGKIVHFDAQVALTATKGVPFANIAIILAILFESVGGTLLLIGKKGASIGALLLILFTAIVTPIFFDFWNNPKVINNFMSNIAIIGGLLFMFFYYLEDDLKYLKKIIRKKA